MGGNPSLWLFGRIPNSHVGSCRAVFESVCLWIHCQSSVGSTWAPKFNINFNSKRFLLFPRLLISYLSMTSIYSLMNLKDFTSLYLYPFSTKRHTFISFLLHSISLSVRNIHHFSDTKDSIFFLVRLRTLIIRSKIPYFYVYIFYKKIATIMKYL